MAPTATRITWTDIEPQVRGAVEAELGAAVVSTVDAQGGYSPSFASRCELSDGREVFVKAVSSDQNPVSPTMLRHEVRVTRDLPEAVPAPRLRHSYDDGRWVVAVFDAIDGVLPRQPWDGGELVRVFAAIEWLAGLVDPCPVAGLEPIAQTYGRTFTGWRTLAGAPGTGDLDPWTAANLDRLTALEAQWADATVGDALVHFDVRADNVLLGRDGEVWFVDWANATRGASWVDTVLMLPSVALQGGPDPSTALEMTSVPAAADPDAVTALVVALAGFFTRGATLPPPPGLPHLRAFQAAQGEVARAWVRERIG
jgi:phosphotransferase family enzyme